MLINVMILSVTINTLEDEKQKKVRQSSSQNFLTTFSESILTCVPFVFSQLFVASKTGYSYGKTS